MSSLLQRLEKENWQEFVLMIWRTVWFVGIVVGILDVTSFQRQDGVLFYGLVFVWPLLVYLVPMISLKVSQTLYLLTEFIFSGSLVVALTVMGYPDVVGNLFILMAGFYSQGRSYLWSAPLFVCVFPVLIAGLGDLAMREAASGMIDSIFAFAVGWMMNQLVSSRKQVQHYARQVEQLTRKEERNRVSADLHDSIGHTFTSVIMGLETVRAEAESAQTKEKLTQLLHTLRSGLEAARGVVHELKPSELDLPLVEQLGKIVEDFGQNTSAEVVFSVNGEVRIVPASIKLLLIRCLQESLTNAIRHGRARRIRASVYFSGESVELVVEDDGKGTRDLRMGFGLTAMQERLAAAQGTLKLESFLDRGMTVRCQVPLPAIEAETVRILVADDQELVRESLTELLKRERGVHIVGTAENGKQAVELCEQTNPEVVVMDVHMPELDGGEAAKEIKQRFPQTKVILLTGFAELERAAEALHYGAEAYLRKSIPPAELLDSIRRVAQGETLISPELARSLAGHFVQGDHQHMGS
ncbi:MAG: response regulator, partial [Clostridia bacterium]